MADLHGAGSYDRTSDDVLTLTGQWPLACRSSSRIMRRHSPPGQKWPDCPSTRRKHSYNHCATEHEASKEASPLGRQEGSQRRIRLARQNGFELGKAMRASRRVSRICSRRSFTKSLPPPERRKARSRRSPVQYNSDQSPSVQLAKTYHDFGHGSSGRNMMDLLHVMVGGGGLRRTAAVLTRTHVWRVPVPPVMFGVRLFVVVVVLRRFA
jgi:hypothetical protein